MTETEHANKSGVQNQTGKTVSAHCMHVFVCAWDVFWGLG